MIIDVQIICERNEGEGCNIVLHIIFDLDFVFGHNNGENDGLSVDKGEDEECDGGERR